jgi:hypothetical protein
VPLLAAGALLLVGCVLGAGGAAVGALVVGHHHGDEMRMNRYDRWDDPRRGGPGWGGPQGPGGFGGPNGRHGRPWIEQPPAQPAPAPSAAVPAPTASS